MMRFAAAAVLLLASSAAHADCSPDLSGNWRAYILQGTGSARHCTLKVSAGGVVLSGTCTGVPINSGQVLTVRRKGSQFAVAGSCIIKGRIELPGCECSLVFDTGSLVGSTAHGVGYKDGWEHPGLNPDDFSFVLARH